MYETYLDEEGRRWIRLDEQTIWNSEVGYGVWSNGRGLTLEPTPPERNLE